jgi:23S rRNA pseudouridine955/2504/2580 synthase
LIKSKRLYLHAHLAGFTHPRTGEKMRIESPLPFEFEAMMKAFDQPEKTTKENSPTEDATKR